MQSRFSCLWLIHAVIFTKKSNTLPLITLFQKKKDFVETEVMHYPVNRWLKILISCVVHFHLFYHYPSLTHFTSSLLWVEHKATQQQFPSIVVFYFLFYLIWAGAAEIFLLSLDSSPLCDHLLLPSGVLSERIRVHVEESRVGIFVSWCCHLGKFQKLQRGFWKFQGGGSQKPKLVKEGMNKI